MNFNPHRQVNISSHASSRSRSQIIEDARKKRLQRQQRQERQHAVEVISRFWRSILIKRQWTRVEMRQQLENEIHSLEGAPSDSLWPRYRRIIGLCWLMGNHENHFALFHSFLWKFFIFWVQGGGQDCIRVENERDLLAFVWLQRQVSNVLCGGTPSQSTTRFAPLSEKDQQLYIRLMLKMMEPAYYSSKSLHQRFIEMVAPNLVHLFSLVLSFHHQEDDDVMEVDRDEDAPISRTAGSQPVLRMSPTSTPTEMVFKMLHILWSKLFQHLSTVSTIENLVPTANVFCHYFMESDSIQTFTSKHNGAFLQLFNIALGHSNFVTACFCNLSMQADTRMVASGQGSVHNADTNNPVSGRTNQPASESTPLPPSSVLTRQVTIASNIKYVLKSHIIKVSGVPKDPRTAYLLVHYYLMAMNHHLPQNLDQVLQKKNIFSSTVLKEIRTSASKSHFALLTQLMDNATVNGKDFSTMDASYSMMQQTCNSLCLVHEKLCAIAQSSDFASIFAFGLKLWLRVLWHVLKQCVQEWSDSPPPLHATILHTFCASYIQNLELLSDDEFLSNKGVLSVEDNLQITFVMKHLVFSLYTDERNKTLRRKIQRVMQLLYDIDMRRRWAPEGHWIHPTAEKIEFSHLEGANMSVFAEEEEDMLEGGQQELSQSNAPSRRMRLQRRARQQSLSKDVLWSILNNIPFILSFKKRLSIFTHFIKQEQVSLARRFMPPVTIQRDNVFSDAFVKLSHLNMKRQLNIQFESNGEIEAGIGAGVQKEFLTLLCADAFSPQYGLFLETPQRGMIYPNPHSDIASEDSLEKFEFLGQVLACAIFFRILVSVPLTSFFLKLVLQKRNSVNDLYEYDPQLFKNLMYVKNNDVTDLGLTFTVSDEVFGTQQEVELIPRGATTAVTNENKERYVAEVANYRLNKQIKAQSRAFSKGMRLVLNENWLDLFSEKELRLIISGGNDEISVQEWKKHTIYGSRLDPSDRQIQWFWEIVEELDEEDRKKLLKFATASNAPPIEGFEALDPKFALMIDPHAEFSRLPSSSTCVNLLKMPRYQNRDQMKEKLLKAIREVESFELT